MKNITFILATALIILNSCKWEPTPEAVQMMEELEGGFQELVDQFPKEGQEVEINPTTPLTNVGFLGDRDSYRVILAEEQEIIAVCNGNYDYSELSKDGHMWLTTAHLSVFDEKPSLGAPNYYSSDHEQDVNMVHKAQHIGVFRTIKRVDGEYHGTTVDKPSTYEGWFFLIDLQDFKIVGATKIVTENDDEFYGYEGENPLTENLYDNIIHDANKKINEWASTEGIWYFGFFDPDEID